MELGRSVEMRTPPILPSKYPAQPLIVPTEPILSVLHLRIGANEYDAKFSSSPFRHGDALEPSLAIVTCDH